MLYITEVILDTIDVPRDPDSGNEKNVVFGLLNFEFNKLHVMMYEFIGEITGVFVDKNDCVVLNVVEGNVPVEKPNKLAKAWVAKLICGVVAVFGKDQLFVGFVYPNDNAVASVGIA